MGATKKQTPATRKPKRGEPKPRTETFSTKEELLAKLIPQCEREYKEKFGHPWSANRLHWVENLTRRWKMEAEAGRIMNAFGKAAAKAISFFDSHHLETHRPYDGLLYLNKLHEMVAKRRHFLDSLVQDIGEKHEIAPSQRHWLAWFVNDAAAHPFGMLPYGRKLNTRELTILSILMTQGQDIDLREDMTTGVAIEQELRRVARAAERAPHRKKKSTRARP